MVSAYITDMDTFIEELSSPELWLKPFCIWEQNKHRPLMWHDDKCPGYLARPVPNSLPNFLPNSGK